MCRAGLCPPLSAAAAAVEMPLAVAPFGRPLALALFLKPCRPFKALKLIPNELRDLLTHLTLHFFLSFLF